MILMMVRIGLMVMVMVLRRMMTVMLMMLIVTVMVLRMMGPENPLSLSHWSLFGGFVQLDLACSQMLDTEY